MENNFYKIVKDNEGKLLFRLSVRFDLPLSVILVLLKENEAWTVLVGPTEIQEQAETVNMKTAEYYAKLKDYFMETATGIQFRFADCVFLIELLLKNNMKVKFFSVNMEMVCFNTCALKLLDDIHSGYVDIIHKLNKTTEEKIEFERSNTEYKQKLNDLVDRKQSDEQDLYNNFMVLLNEKKRRIQHLNELLLAFKRGRPVLNTPVVKAKSTARAKNKKNIKEEINEIKEKIEIKKTPESESEFESDRSYNTDEEQEENQIRKLKSFRTNIDFNPKPSTSKNFNLIDSSPPHYSLPKRIKEEPLTTVYNHTINEGQSSKEPKAMEIAESCTTPSVNTTVTFNTQDILNEL